MAKKAAAQNGRADLPVSQDARQRVCGWHANYSMFSEKPSAPNQK
jgi:hypothetical protein